MWIRAELIKTAVYRFDVIRYESPFSNHLIDKHLDCVYRWYRKICDAALNRKETKGD